MFKSIFIFVDCKQITQLRLRIILLLRLCCDFSILKNIKTALQPLKDCLMVLLDQRTKIRTKKTRKTFIQKALIEVCF